MPEHYVFPEFRDQFENVRYPFVDSATLLSDTQMLLPSNAFLDLVLHAYGAVGPVHLRQVVVGTETVVFRFADPDFQEVASGTMELLTIPDNLPLLDTAGRNAGLIVSNTLRLSAFATWPLGTHTFTPEATELVPSVVVPLPAVGVQAIELPDGTRMTGDVWLVGDNGVVFRQVGDDIRFDVVGDPLFRRRLCDPLGKFVSPSFVRTINNQPPDQYGNFDLQVADEGSARTILRIYPRDGEIFVEAVGQTPGG